MRRYNQVSAIEQWHAELERAFSELRRAVDFSKGTMPADEKLCTPELCCSMSRSNQEAKAICQIASARLPFRLPQNLQAYHPPST
jgi:hypothetical protein